MSFVTTKGCLALAVIKGITLASRYSESMFACYLIWVRDEKGNRQSTLCLLSPRKLIFKPKTLFRFQFQP